MNQILCKEEIEKLRELEDMMRKSLKDSRFRHTVSVAHTAAALAMVNECSLYKALLSGMLHDCAKCYKDSELLVKCRKKEIEITSIEEENPSLLHAKYGAYLAEHRYGITDPEILSAIRCHTTGKPEMSTLDKIIFIADYIEPYRIHTDLLPYIRKLSFENLDKGLVFILKRTLEYLKTTGEPVDEMTKTTYEYYTHSVKAE